MAINILDIIIMATFVAVIGVGFFNGVARVTSAIIAMYFATLVAAAFYRPLTDAVRKYVPTMSLKTGRLFFFSVLFLVATLAFTYIVSRWLGNMKLPRRLQILDNVGGAALGIIVSGLAVTLAAMLLVVMVQALNQTYGGAGDASMVGWVHTQMQGSELVPVFLRFSPYFERIVKPWFPGGMPPILAGSAQG